MPDRLATVNEVVRRVIGARVRDPHLVEDLTQETLVRVAAVRESLPADALQAYAIATARNVVIGQARSDAVSKRHAHRLVEYTSLAGPEALVLEREETDALAAALEHLDPQDRRLLLRHEDEGTSVEELANEAGTSKGAVAMRLARARAALRVEFLLAFRRVELPTSRCRPVLTALSAGDRRRQRELDAAAHLLRCPTCAALARPVSERRRGIAIWLIGPAAAVVRRAASALRHHRGVQVGAAAATVAVGALVAFALVSPDGPSARHPASAAAPATTTTAAAAAVVVTSAPVSVTVPTTVAPTPACAAPVPLDQLVPAASIGCPVAPTSLRVVEVPKDEAFWGETANGTLVWVQLIGHGESPVHVERSTTVVVVGTIADPATLGPANVDLRAVAAGFFLQVRYQDISAG